MCDAAGFPLCWRHRYDLRDGHILGAARPQIRPTTMSSSVTRSVVSGSVEPARKDLLRMKKRRCVETCTGCRKGNRQKLPNVLMKEDGRRRKSVVEGTTNGRFIRQSTGHRESTESI